MEHWEHRVVKRTDEEGEYLTVEGVLLDNSNKIVAETSFDQITAASNEELREILKDMIGSLDKEVVSGINDYDLSYHEKTVVNNDTEKNQGNFVSPYVYESTDGGDTLKKVIKDSGEGMYESPDGGKTIYLIEGEK